MTVVTFTSYRPGKRYDQNPWTQARIEQRQLTTDAWDPVETLDLVPLDDDPTEPRVRNFTTEEATLDVGFYRLVFLDEDGNEDPTEALAWPPEATVVPTLEQIGAINRSRTVDDRGQVLGTFTAETRPTSDEVDVLARLAADQVGDTLGSVPAAFIERAQGVAALYGAVLVESGADDPRTELMKQWTAMADARLKSLAAEITQDPEGDDGTPDGSSGPGPLFSFPPAAVLPPGA